ncbi:RNA polymerase sigma factor [Methylocella silvestris]|uniref:RNA polymerase subunit sigma-24 n=1 Tax=Methylocella silvestris TaxID=199596 RepID=A0A2J7TET3_METSI|nr:sigma-70 family RNA polymerase sigma factor [Methylocella silvestris]PNG25267.1 RNA polymerase subunit sigma-24 [Methylocella silvestris]
MTDAIEQYIPALRRYAFALIRDHDGADDLVQDCLERALSRWYLRRSDGDLRAWLFAIMRNHYIDGYRGRKRRGPHVALDEARELSVPAGQDRGLEAREAMAALDQLPEEQKSLLLLIGVEDLSYEEAARALGVPVGTVMSRLSRARQRLRAMLETGPTTYLRRIK